MKEGGSVAPLAGRGRRLRLQRVHPRPQLVELAAQGLLVVGARLEPLFERLDVRPHRHAIVPKPHPGEDSTGTGCYG